MRDSVTAKLRDNNAIRLSLFCFHIIFPGNRNQTRESVAVKQHSGMNKLPSEQLTGHCVKRYLHAKLKLRLQITRKDLPYMHYLQVLIVLLLYSAAESEVKGEEKQKARLY